MNGGGHAAAAGVRVRSEDLYAFREKINEYYRSLHLTNQEKYLKLTADLDTDNIGDFDLNFLAELRELEPFGPGNEEPIFQLNRPEILLVRPMGDKEQHLRIDVRGKDGKIIKLVAFFAPERWFTLSEEDECDFLIRPIENEWRSVRSVEGRLLDVLWA